MDTKIKYKCPLCGAEAERKRREEQDDSGPGSFFYTYIQCTSCGIRSRENILWPSNSKELEVWEEKK